MSSSATIAPARVEVQFRNWSEPSVRPDGSVLTVEDLVRLQADADRDSDRLAARGAHWGMTSHREVAGRSPDRRMTARRAENGLLWATYLEHRVLAAEVEEVEDVEDGSWDRLSADASLLVDAYASWVEFWREYRRLLAGLPPTVLAVPAPPNADLVTDRTTDEAPPGVDPASLADELVCAPGAPAAGRSVRPRL